VDVVDETQDVVDALDPVDGVRSVPKPCAQVRILAGARLRWSECRACDARPSDPSVRETDARHSTRRRWISRCAGCRIGTLSRGISGCVRLSVRSVSVDCASHQPPEVNQPSRDARRRQAREFIPELAQSSLRCGEPSAFYFCKTFSGGVNMALSSPISSAISALSFWFMADSKASSYLGWAGLAKLSISSGSDCRS